MDEKQILTGIDECTLVLSAEKTDIESIEDWQPKAESMIAEFERLAALESIFGERKELDGRCPQGYDTAYQYGDHPFYFAVAYHPLHPQMGVVVKYSAYAWAEYCRKGNTDIKKFIHAVQSDSYHTRFSRIDFTADYLNWPISVDGIYQSLIENRLEIQDYNGKRNNSTISAMEVDGTAGTFYVGSKKSGTRLFLRVYNKKAEQMETRGFRFHEAVQLQSWIRFEAVYKGSYAHQLTDILMETKETDLQDFIADKIAEKFRFYDLEQEQYTDFTAALLEKPERQFQRLRLESPRDNDFLSSLLHLANGSGLFSTLYKSDEIWGQETSISLLQHLHRIYLDEYKPNDDVRLWLKKHKGALESQTLEKIFQTLKAAKNSEAEQELSA